MDYLSYFQLVAEPFANSPLAQFYFASRQHTDALSRLLYAAGSMKGLAILVGEIGHGKTMLARRLLEALPEQEFEAAMLVIVHSGVTPEWLLKRIALQLGVQNPREDKVTLLSQLYERLIEIYQAGKRAVVIIDEAQMLNTRQLMEEFRGLLNLEVSDRKLISFCLFGLPQLEVNLRLDPPLAQRIGLLCRLRSFSPDDTAAYIQHRLAVAGARETLFAQDAYPLIHAASQGIPRVINTLCDNCLLEIFFTRGRYADATLVGDVATNLGIAVDRLEMPSAPSTFTNDPLYEQPEDNASTESATLISELGFPGQIDSNEIPDINLTAMALAARVALEPMERDTQLAATSATPSLNSLDLPSYAPQEDLFAATTTPTTDVSLQPKPTAQPIVVRTPTQPLNLDEIDAILANIDAGI